MSTKKTEVSKLTQEDKEPSKISAYLSSAFWAKGYRCIPQPATDEKSKEKPNTEQAAPKGSSTSYGSFS